MISQGAPRAMFPECVLKSRTPGSDVTNHRLNEFQGTNSVVSPQGPVSFCRSFSFAIRGFGEAIWEQRNMRCHLVTAIGVCIAAACLRVSSTEWALLLLCIGLVVSMELVNTAVETVVDLVSPEHHELARKAKDIAAGAVFFASLIAICVGLLLLGPPFLQWATSMIPSR